MAAKLLAQFVFILGITNLLSLALVVLSCRCMLHGKLSRKLWETGGYQKFFNYHCGYWRIFFVSVLLHATLALIVYGIPF